MPHGTPMQTFGVSVAHSLSCQRLVVGEVSEANKLLGIAAAFPLSQSLSTK